ncbi:RHS repeat-associated core domain-containing protein, partial [Frankia sp. Cas4]|uniref:RHS repeat-associated core domain-containing protein n=1 Tax=Frankia sp. Cas4 TaxID=3073927 RepID=UPI002AD2E5BD
KPRTWRYSWDADDRLTGVTTPDGWRWRYSYDPFGRRIAKQRLTGDSANGTADDGGVTEQVDFAWDGMVLAEQHHVSGDDPTPRVTTWDWEPGGFRPLTQTERRLSDPAVDDGDGSAGRNAEQEWFDARFHAIVTDLVGTPTELVDPDGALSWQARTTLWGAGPPSSSAGGAVDCPLRFPGQYHDPETGAHYNVHRYYDPETARYESTDPLGLAPAPNPHTYVPNPLGWLDPLGLAPYTILSVIHEDSRLVKEAETAGRTHQRSIDNLTSQLSRGNLNPGIGSKYLFDDVFEARARDGARVYFRNIEDRVAILAKSSKANQPRVIGILRELYGQ